MRSQGMPLLPFGDARELGLTVPDLSSTERSAEKPVTALGIIAQNLDSLKERAGTLGYGDAVFSGFLEESSRLAGGVEPPPIRRVRIGRNFTPTALPTSCSSPKCSPGTSKVNSLSSWSV